MPINRRSLNDVMQQNEASLRSLNDTPLVSKGGVSPDQVAAQNNSQGLNIIKSAGEGENPFLANRIEGLGIDNSMFEALGANRFGEDLGWSYDDVNLRGFTPRVSTQDIYKDAAYSQSWGQTFMKGVGRTLNTIVFEFLKTPGQIVGGIGDILYQDLANQNSEYLDNAWIRFFQGAQDYINDNHLQIYHRGHVTDDDSLWRHLGTREFWFNEGADGLGFMLAFLIPGAILKAADFGTRIVRASDLIRRTTANNKVSKLMAFRTMSATQASGRTVASSSRAAEKINSTLAVLINTISEAGAETSFFQIEQLDRLRNQIQQEGLESHEGLMRILEENPGMDVETAMRTLIAEQSSNVFYGNLGILAISNTILERVLFGGFGARGANRVYNRIKNHALRGEAGAAFRTFTRADYAKEIGRKIAGGVASEGFWEEGMQEAFAEYFGDRVDIGRKQGNFSDRLSESIGGILGQYVENLGDLQAQKAIFLGGFFGSTMHVIGGVRGMRRSSRVLEGTEEKKGELFGSRELGKALGMQAVQAHDGVANMVRDTYLTYDEGFKLFKADPTTGRVIVEEDQLLDFIKKTTKDTALLEELSEALERRDEDAFKVALHKIVLSELQPLIGIEGAERFLLEDFIPFIAERQQELLELNPEFSQTAAQDIQESLTQLASQFIHVHRTLSENHVNDYKLKADMFEDATAEMMRKHSNMVLNHKMGLAMNIYIYNQLINDHKNKQAKYDEVQQAVYSPAIRRKIEAYEKAIERSKAELTKLFDKKEQIAHFEAVNKISKRFKKGALKVMKEAKETALSKKAVLQDKEGNRYVVRELSQSKDEDGNVTKKYSVNALGYSQTTDPETGDTLLGYEMVEATDADGNVIPILSDVTADQILDNDLGFEIVGWQEVDGEFNYVTFEGLNKWNKADLEKRVKKARKSLEKVQEKHKAYVKDLDNIQKAQKKLDPSSENYSQTQKIVENSIRELTEEIVALQEEMDFLNDQISVLVNLLAKKHRSKEDLNNEPEINNPEKIHNALYGHNVLVRPPWRFFGFAGRSLDKIDEQATDWADVVYTDKPYAQRYFHFTANINTLDSQSNLRFEASFLLFKDVAEQLFNAEEIKKVEQHFNKESNRFGKAGEPMVLLVTDRNGMPVDIDGNPLFNLKKGDPIPSNYLEIVAEKGIYQMANDPTWAREPSYMRYHEEGHHLFNKLLDDYKAARSLAVQVLESGGTFSLPITGKSYGVLFNEGMEGLKELSDLNLDTPVLEFEYIFNFNATDTHPWGGAVNNSRMYMAKGTKVAYDPATGTAIPLVARRFVEQEVNTILALLDVVKQNSKAAFSELTVPGHPNVKVKDALENYLPNNMEIKFIRGNPVVVFYAEGVGENNLTFNLSLEQGIKELTEHLSNTATHSIKGKLLNDVKAREGYSYITLKEDGTGFESVMYTASEGGYIGYLASSVRKAGTAPAVFNTFVKGREKVRNTENPPFKQNTYLTMLFDPNYVSKYKKSNEGVYGDNFATDNQYFSREPDPNTFDNTNPTTKSTETGRVALLKYLEESKTDNHTVKITEKNGKDSLNIVFKLSFHRNHFLGDNRLSIIPEDKPVPFISYVERASIKISKDLKTYTKVLANTDILLDFYKIRQDIMKAKDAQKHFAVYIKSLEKYYKKHQKALNFVYKKFKEEDLDLDTFLTLGTTQLTDQKQLDNDLGKTIIYAFENLNKRIFDVKQFETNINKGIYSAEFVTQTASKNTVSQIFEFVQRKSKKYKSLSEITDADLAGNHLINEIVEWIQIDFAQRKQDLGKNIKDKSVENIISQLQSDIADLAITDEVISVEQAIDIINKVFGEKIASKYNTHRQLRATQEKIEEARRKEEEEQAKKDHTNYDFVLWVKKGNQYRVILRDGKMIQQSKQKGSKFFRDLDKKTMTSNAMKRSVEKRNEIYKDLANVIIDYRQAENPDNIMIVLRDGKIVQRIIPTGGTFWQDASQPSKHKIAAAKQILDQRLIDEGISLDPTEGQELTVSDNKRIRFVEGNWIAEFKRGDNWIAYKENSKTGQKILEEGQKIFSEQSGYSVLEIPMETVVQRIQENKDLSNKTEEINKEVDSVSQEITRLEAEPKQLEEEIDIFDEFVEYGNNKSETTTSSPSQESLSDLLSENPTEGSESDNPLNRIVLDLNQANYVLEDIDHAKQWLKYVLPQANLEFVEGLIDNNSFGRLVNSGILLSTIAEQGTIYHEAFHYVTQFLLNPRERKNLYREFVRRNLGQTIYNREYGDIIVDEHISERQIEEYLAEQFREYQLTQEMPNMGQYQKTFFDKVLEFIQNILNLIGVDYQIKDFGPLQKIRNRNNIETIFSNISSGRYSKSPVINRANEDILFNRKLEHNHIDAAIELEVFEMMHAHVMNKIYGNPESIQYLFNSELSHEYSPAELITEGINQAYKEVANTQNELAEWADKFQQAYDSATKEEQTQYANALYETKQQAKDLAYMLVNWEEIDSTFLHKFGYYETIEEATVASTTIPSILKGYQNWFNERFPVSITLKTASQHIQDGLTKDHDDQYTINNEESLQSDNDYHWNKIYMSFSSKENAGSLIKFLLSGVVNIDKADNTVIPSTNLGFSNLVKFEEVFATIINNTADLTNYDNFLNELSTIQAEYIPGLAKLLNALSFTLNNDSSQDITGEVIDIRTKFLKAFQNTKTIYSKDVIHEDQISVMSVNSTNSIEQKLREAENKFLSNRQEYLKVDEFGNKRYQFPKSSALYQLAKGKVGHENANIFAALKELGLEVENINSLKNNKTDYNNIVRFTGYIAAAIVRGEMTWLSSTEHDHQQNIKRLTAIVLKYSQQAHELNVMSSAQEIRYSAVEHTQNTKTIAEINQARSFQELQDTNSKYNDPTINHYFHNDPIGHSPILRSLFKYNTKTNTHLNTGKKLVVETSLGTQGTRTSNVRNKEYKNFTELEKFIKIFTDVINNRIPYTQAHDSDIYKTLSVQDGGTPLTIISPGNNPRAKFSGYMIDALLGELYQMSVMAQTDYMGQPLIVNHYDNKKYDTVVFDLIKSAAESPNSTIQQKNLLEDIQTLIEAGNNSIKITDFIAGKRAVLESVFNAFYDQQVDMIDRFLMDPENSIFLYKDNQYENKALITYKDNNRNPSIIVNREKIRELAEQFVLKYAVGQMEINKLFMGNMAFFKNVKDYIKRGAGLHGPSVLSATDVVTNDFVKNKLDDLNKYNRNKEFDNSPHINYVMVNEFKWGSRVQKLLATTLGQAISENSAYGKMDVADAGSVMHIAEFREFLVRNGQWSPKLEVMYQFEMDVLRNLKKGTIRESAYFGDGKLTIKNSMYNKLNGKTIDLNNLEKSNFFGYAFNPQKPLGFGNALLGVDLFIPTYLKLASTVLSPIHAAAQQLKADRTADKNFENTILQVIQKMEEQAVGMIIVPTGVKLGGLQTKTNEGYDLYTEDSNYSKVNPEQFPIISRLPYKNFGVQVQVAPKKKSEGPGGSQFQKKVRDGLYDNAMPKDWLAKNFPNYKSTNTTLRNQALAKWNELTDAQKIESSKYHRIVQELDSLIDSKIKISVDQFLAEIGIDVMDSNKLSEASVEKLIRKLKDTLKASNAAPSSLDAVNSFASEFRLDAVPTSKRLQQMLYKLFDKHSIRQKVHGAGLTLTPSIFFEVKRDDTHDADGFDSAGLNFYFRKYTDSGKVAIIDKNKIKEEDYGKLEVTQIEAYLPHYFKGLVESLNLDTSNIDINLLKLIGFRIPTQGLNSIESIKIKGFLPPHMGNTIIMPQELVEKAGSDFDFDTLYVYYPNYYIEDNTPKYTKYIEGSTPEAVKARFDQHQKVYGRKGHNAIITHNDFSKLRGAYKGFFKELKKKANKEIYNKLQSALIPKIQEVAGQLRIPNPSRINSIPSLENAIESKLNTFYDALVKSIKSKVSFKVEDNATVDTILNKLNDLYGYLPYKESPQFYKDILEEISNYESFVDSYNVVLKSLENSLKGEQDAWLKGNKQLVQYIKDEISYERRLELFSELSVEQQNGLEAIQNKMMELYHELILDSRRFEDLIKPIGNEFLDQQQAELSELLGEESGIVNRPLDLISPLNAIKNQHNTLDAADGIGIAANNSSLLTNLTQNPVKLLDTYIQDIHIGRKLSTKISIIKNDAKQLGNLFTEGGYNSLSITNEVLNAFVDFVAHEYDLNTETAGIFLMLLQRGANPKAILRVFKQPKIKRMLDIFSKKKSYNYEGPYKYLGKYGELQLDNSGKLVAKKSVPKLLINELLNESSHSLSDIASHYGIEMLDVHVNEVMADNSKHITLTDLNDMLSKPINSWSKDLVGKQIQLIHEFVRYIDMGSQMVWLTQVTNQDAKGIGQSFASDIYRNVLMDRAEKAQGQYDLFFDQSSLENFLTSKFPGIIHKRSQETRNILGEFNKVANTRHFRDFIYPIVDTYISRGNTSMQNIHNLIENMFNGYVMTVLSNYTMVDVFDNNRAVDYRLPQLKETVMRGTENYPSVAQQVLNIQKNPSHSLYKNELIRLLKPVINRNESHPDNVILENIKIDADLEGVLREAWVAIEENHPNLARDLFYGLLLQSGLQPGRNNWVNIIGAEKYRGFIEGIFRQAFPELSSEQSVNPQATAFADKISSMDLIHVIARNFQHNKDIVGNKKVVLPLNEYGDGYYIKYKKHFKNEKEKKALLKQNKEPFTSKLYYLQEGEVIEVIPMSYIKRGAEQYISEYNFTIPTLRNTEKVKPSEPIDLTPPAFVTPTTLESIGPKVVKSPKTLPITKTQQLPLYVKPKGLQGTIPFSTQTDC